MALQHSHRAPPNALEARRSRTGSRALLMAAALLPCKNGLLSHEGLKALLHRQRASASLSLQLLTSPLPQDAVGAVLGLFS